MKSRAIILIDLLFGDQGKGTFTDYFSHLLKSNLVVRFNGGAQAAHRVVTPDGLEHIFSQFGSGTFTGSGTYLSAYMVISPAKMISEELQLRKLGFSNAFKNVFVDSQALIISPYEKAINRLRELVRGTNCHGSCGLGVGETRSDFLKYGPKIVISASDLIDPGLTLSKLRRLRELKLAELEKFRRFLPDNQAVQDELRIFEEPKIAAWALSEYRHWRDLVKLVDLDWLRDQLTNNAVIFEHAQGVLLDEKFGFHPFTTWTDTTGANAVKMLTDIGYRGQVKKIGIVRAMATRHGPGPFPTHEESVTADLPDNTNTLNPWQKDFRVGYQDLVLLRYALKLTGKLDGLAVSCLDRMDKLPVWQAANSYSYQGHRLVSSNFEYQDREIKSIRMFSHPSIMKQKEITKILMDCSPTYEELSPKGSTEQSALQYADKLAATLELPLSVASFGPTRKDKVKVNFS